MRWLRITRFAGLCLLGLSELVALIWLWFILTPLPPGVEFDKRTPREAFAPLSHLWYWGVGITCFLLLVSLILSSNRVRQAALISLCISGLIAVFWIRSHQDTQFKWALSRTYLFPDHREGHNCAINVSDGGIHVHYRTGATFYGPDDEDLLRNDPGFKVVHFVFTRNSRELVEKDNRGKFYPGSYRDSNIWEGGKLDHMGIQFWAREIPSSTTLTTMPRLYLRGITLPFWLIIIPFQIFPALWAIQLYRRWRRKHLNLCVKCAYQLQGITSDKCPECGHPIPPRKEIAKAPAAVKPVA